jgi:aminopeptidase YwaD
LLALAASVLVPAIAPAEAASGPASAKRSFGGAPAKGAFVANESFGASSPALGRDALAVARHVASFGPRPAAGATERRAHGFVERAFRRAGLRVGVQPVAVPGKGASRNVIGVLDTPQSCLRIVMAHTDTMPAGPGANDNASGVGVVVAVARRLGALAPSCDVWLVAIGAEERGYTGSPDHLGALALARRARARGGAERLRFALSLDEVGRDRPFWLRSPRSIPRPSVEGALLRAGRGAGTPVSWVRDEGSGNSDHREFELLGLSAAKLGVGAGGEPCRHSACDTPERLDRRSLAQAQRFVEHALR